MRKVAGLLVLAVCVFGLGFALGAQNAPASAQAEPKQDVDELFSPFWETWDLLHQVYVDVEKLDDNALMEGALRGMLEAVGDSNTAYMDPEAFRMSNEDLEGSFEGIGAYVRKDEETGALRIVSVIATSPAETAGILADDAIVEVNGENITHLSQDEIISRVRGPAGSTVRLGIRRPGVSGLIEINVTRARVDIPLVESRMIGDIAYVRLTQFGALATEQLRKALADLNAQEPAGLILDLRGNPGGYLQTAIDVANEFLPEGPVLIERSALNETVHQATSAGLAEDVPMVALVDQGSASASELLAGALQDRKRAVIVGAVTFGKGTVQTWRPLVNGGGVRITIARWYTPGDRSIDGEGLSPDLIVNWPASGVSGDFDPQLEAALRVLRGQSVWPTWPLPLAADGALMRR